jgi:hypothetical protein
VLARLAVPAGALIASGAAWLSLGTIAQAHTDGPRMALLPVSTGSVALSLAAGVIVYLVGRAGGSLAPLWLLTLIALPWLPVRIPPAFLAWDAALRWLVWFAVAWIMARSVGLRPYGLSWRVGPSWRAGLLALAIFGTAAWQVAPSVPGGDEPHYLVITQSLLLDGDLRIENNHRRGDYQAYYPGSLRPDFLRRGGNGEIYSIHAPGLSVLVAPAFFVGGYPAVVAFLVVIAALGSALTWHVTWLATREPRASWFGWAAVTLSATAIFHAFTVYPDGVGGVIVLTGIWALLRAELERTNGVSRLRPWLLHGAALALLPWLHTRFALLAGSLGALTLLRLARTREPAGKAVAFLAVPAVSALAWVGYFIAIYGTPDPSAPYGGAREFSLAYIPGGLAGLLFDQRFGLIANAPALSCALAGVAVMAASRRPMPAAMAAPGPSQRLGLELLFLVVPYLLTVTNFAMWWGGWSAPARFAAPVLPVLAIPCAVAWTTVRTRATRAWAAGALGITAFISSLLVFADGGRLAFNTREGYALWLDRWSKLADLGQGLPAWFRGRENMFFAEIAVWLGAFVAAWVAVRTVEARVRPRSARFATTAAMTSAVAMMMALTVVWRLHRVDGMQVAPAQLELLRRLPAEPRAVGFSLTPVRLLARDQALSLLRIEARSGSTQAGGAGRADRPLIVLPAVPAGRYRVETRGAGDGWIMIGIGQDQFALRTERVSSPAGALEVEFPVDVRALIVRGDEDARRSVTSVVVQPLGLAATPKLTGEYARRAVRYGRATVYFLDERSFPEPEAVWVGGARRSSWVIQPDDRRDRVDLLLRNAPVENRLTIEIGKWREELALGPGEERRVRVPLDGARGATLVTFAASTGFRPSAVEPGSRDDRFLGVWVRVE